MTDTKIKINLNGEFTALELEEIIGDLALARAGMNPPVPTSPPSHMSPEAVITEQENALFIFRTLIDGGIRVYLRSEGFGWLAFRMDATDVDGIRELLNKKLGDSYTSH